MRRTALHSNRGVTLMELMIAVAIIGILAAIAYPSYSEQVRRGQRAEARSVMLEASQFMQRYYSSNDTYADAALPDALSRSPAHGTQLYEIQIAEDSATRTGYTLEAVPQGALASDKCGTLTLTSTGVRGRSGTGDTVQNCWR